MQNNQPQNTFLPFLSAKYLLGELFGISMSDQDFVEKGMRIWRSIGNVAVALHEYEVTIPDNGVVAMPCNMESIEAVTVDRDHCAAIGAENNVFIHDASNNQLFQYQAQYVDTYGTTPGYTQDYSRQNLEPRSQHYIAYQLVGYKGNYSLEFGSDYVGQTVFILYKAIVVATDGLPLINPKEQLAIAYKAAYEVTNKKAFMNDQTALQLLEMVKNDSGIKMAAAKIPETLTQNEMDSVLRAMTRHDRKTYGYSYQPIT